VAGFDLPGDTMLVLDVARILTRLCSNAIPFLPLGPLWHLNRTSGPGPVLTSSCLRAS